LSPVVEVTVSDKIDNVASSAAAMEGITTQCLLSDASGTIRLKARGSWVKELQDQLLNGKKYQIRGCHVSSEFLPSTLLFEQGRQRILQLEWNSKTKVIGPVGEKKYSENQGGKNKLNNMLSKLTMLTKPKSSLKTMKPTIKDTFDNIFVTTQGNEKSDKLANEGNLLYQTQLYNDALDKYLAAIDLEPNIAAYHAHCAACYLMLGEPDEALSYSVTSVAIDPSSAFAWSLQADACMQLGRVKRAKEACDEAMALEGGARLMSQRLMKVTKMETLGKDYMWARARSDFSAAIEYLNEAIIIANHSKGLKNSRVECFMERGKQYLRLKKFLEAVNDFQEVLRTDKDHVHVDCNRYLRKALEGERRKVEWQKQRKENFKIMGLDETASEAQVKKAFRDLSKALHPDKLVGKTSDQIKEGEVNFKKMKRAFDFIMDLQTDDP